MAGRTGIGERYRLTEYLVIPEHWYDLTGTCVENPEPQDENDRNMIVKGTNEPTFLITWRSEKEIRRTLRNRAAKYIFGGAISGRGLPGYLPGKTRSVLKPKEKPFDGYSQFWWDWS